MKDSRGKTTLPMEQSLPRPQTPQVVHIKSNEPDKIIELPIIQNVNLQTHIIERPEVHVVQRYQDKVHIQEVVKHIPKITYVDREKFVEVPDYRIVEKRVEVPEIITKIIEVPRYEIKTVVVEVPKVVTKHVEKIVEVPHIKYIDRVVEVPQIEEVIRRVPKPKVVEVPVEKIKFVPKVEVKVIEKVVHVPGPLEYREYPVEKPVFYPKPRSVEILKPQLVNQNIFIDVDVNLPVPGDIIDVPFDVETIVKKIVPQYVPGRILEKRISTPVEKVVEIPIPEEKEQLRVLRRERIIPKHVIKEVEVPKIVEETVEVPRYVYIQQPKTIIRPRLIRKYNDLPPIVTTAEPHGRAAERKDNVTGATASVASDTVSKSPHVAAS